MRIFFVTCGVLVSFAVNTAVAKAGTERLPEEMVVRSRAARLLSTVDAAARPRIVRMLRPIDAHSLQVAGSLEQKAKILVEQLRLVNQGATVPLRGSEPSPTVSVDALLSVHDLEDPSGRFLNDMIAHMRENPVAQQPVTPEVAAHIAEIDREHQHTISQLDEIYRNLKDSEAQSVLTKY